MAQSKAELQFQLLLDDLKVDYVAEYDLPYPPDGFFTKARKFRFDFAIVDKKIAFEIDGGLYPTKEQRKRGATMGGQHARPAGILRDRTKDMLAKLEGWEVHRIPAQWMFHYMRHKRQLNLIPYERVKEMVRKFVNH